jgi:hypothetical protein
MVDASLIALISYEGANGLVGKVAGACRTFLEFAGAVFANPCRRASGWDLVSTPVADFRHQAFGVPDPVVSLLACRSPDLGSIQVGV